MLSLSAVNFAGAVAHVASLLKVDATTPSLLTIEMGPHPALTPLATDLLTANGVAVVHGAVSMRRVHSARLV